jgi:hypothetical protein
VFNEAMIRGIADKFVSAGLKDAGYSYVNIDDCWAQPARDGSGNLVTNPTRFPSGWSAPATTAIPVTLAAGSNSIRFFNDAANAPDLDMITLS